MEINQKLQYRLLDRNIRYSNIDGMFFSIMLGSSLPYLGLYILRFNGPDELVNLITAVQPIVLSVFTLLGTAYANSFLKKKALIMPASILQRLFILLIAFIPFLPSAWRAWAFFALWALVYVPWAYAGLAWSPLICNIVPEELRGRFFGTRNALTGLTTLLGTFLTGVVLAKLPYSQAFFGIFLVSFLCTAVSFFFLTKQIEPLVPEPGETKKQIRTSNARMFQLDLKGNLQPFQDPVYGKIFSLSCLAVFIFHVGYSMAGPLYILRQIKQLGFDNAAVSFIATATGITALVGSYAGGRASDKWGYRYVLLFSTLLCLIPPLIWAVTDRMFWLTGAAMLWGLTGNAYMICFLYMVLAASPAKDRSRYVGMNTVIGNMAGALGPLIGIFLVKIPSVNIQGALGAATIIMLAGVFASYYVVKKTSI
jgi:MFS family permease